MSPAERRWAFIKSTGILALFGLMLFLWHRRDTLPPAWDESTHLTLALDYRDWLWHGTPIANSWAAIYTPLYHLSLIPALALHPAVSSVSAVHCLYAALLLLAMAWLARLFGRAADDGLLAGFLVLGTCISHYLARRPIIDFALMCWVAFGMALLLKTEDFHKFRWVLAWAVWSGLGVMLKTFYPIYFVLPCLLLLLFPAQPRAEPFAHPRRAFLIAVAIIVAICLPWFLWFGSTFLQHLPSMMTDAGAEEGDPSMMQMAGWLYYLRAMPSQWGGWGLAAVVGGLVLWLWRARKGREAWFLLAWFFSGYLAFTAMHTKNPRYTVALMPALAMAAVMGWLPETAPRWQRRLAWGVAAVLLVFNSRLERPRTEDWKHAELMRVMSEQHDPTQPFLIASVLSNHPALFGRTLRWSFRASGKRLYSQSTGDPNADFTEFIVVRPGNFGPNSADIQREWERQRDSGRAFTAVYPQVAALQMPDGAPAMVYRRDPQARFQVAPLTRAELERRLTLALKNGLIDGPVTVTISGSPSDWPRGRIERAEVSGTAWKIRGFPIARAHLRLDHVWLNLYRLWDQNKPGLLALGSLSPEVEVRASDLEAMLKDRVHSLDAVHVHFQGGEVTVQVVLKGWPLSAAGRVELRDSPRRLVARLESVRVRGVPIPGWLFGALHLQQIPLDPVPSFPVALRIRDVTLDNDVLQVHPEND